MGQSGRHKRRALIDVIESRGARVVFLPPYRPGFSPIELAWSKVKALLRKWRFRTRSALHQGIQLALAAISPGDAAGWFAHCGDSVAHSI
ncbi:transposase [Corallococcus macrosporus]|uniref:transposase n=1 Tax=Corallococcus macrosporus TaxID=35 RepID=UPI003B831383